MIPTIQILVLLLIVIAAVSVVAARLKIPPAILLVLTGVLVALIPGLPTVTLAPEFVLLFVLPPLIYSSAVAMSWREFRFNLRPISLLAVGCVRVHDHRRRRRHALAAGSLLAGGVRARRHRFAAGCGGAAVDRAPHAAAETASW